MRIVKTYIDEYFNWDEFQYCPFAIHPDDGVCEVPFILKDGTNINVFDPPHAFEIEPNGISYAFCDQCCMFFVELLIESIVQHFTSPPFNSTCMYKYEDYEEQLWKKFIDKISKNKDCLDLYRRGE